jgi:hypothetical protein
MRAARLFPIALLAFASSLAQAQRSAPAPAKTVESKTPADVQLESLSEAQIRDLIRLAAEKDMENDKRQHDYTYVQREEEHKLDGKGQVTFNESKTYEIMELYGESIQRLIAKDDKPLSEKDSAKEEERIQKITDKRKNESDSARKKRLESEEKSRENDRKFVSEVADAYNFKLAGTEQREGRETYVIDAVPRPGYEPHLKDAKFLPKFRFRVWLDKAETQWVQLDIQCIDTVSIGLFLARIHQGSNIQIQQTRINDEVWLPQHIAVKLDARIALLKGVNLSEEVSYRDYKKFRTDSKIVPVGEVQEQK